MKLAEIGDKITDCLFKLTDLLDSLARLYFGKLCWADDPLAVYIFSGPWIRKFGISVTTDGDTILTIYRGVNKKEIDIVLKKHKRAANGNI